VSTGSAWGTSLVAASANTASALVQRDGSGNFNAGSITLSGTITSSSDERLKTNWRELPLDFVELLAEVKNGIYDRVDIEVTQVGVGAQSLQKAMELAVMKDENGYLSVAYGNAALVACIELAKRLIELEKEVRK
jgi:hypothetical protein